MSSGLSHGQVIVEEAAEAESSPMLRESGRLEYTRGATGVVGL